MLLSNAFSILLILGTTSVSALPFDARDTGSLSTPSYDAPQAYEVPEARDFASGELEARSVWNFLPKIIGHLIPDIADGVVSGIQGHNGQGQGGQQKRELSDEDVADVQEMVARAMDESEEYDSVKRDTQGQDQVVSAIVGAINDRLAGGHPKRDSQGQDQVVSALVGAINDRLANGHDKRDPKGFRNPFKSRPGKSGGGRKPSGGKPKPSGGKPSGGKPSGGKPSGGKPSGGKPSGGGNNDGNSGGMNPWIQGGMEMAGNIGGAAAGAAAGTAVQNQMNQHQDGGADANQDNNPTDNQNATETDANAANTRRNTEFVEEFMKRDPKWGSKGGKFGGWGKGAGKAAAKGVGKAIANAAGEAAGGAAGAAVGSVIMNQQDNAPADQPADAGNNTRRDVKSDDNAPYVLQARQAEIAGEAIGAAVTAGIDAIKEAVAKNSQLDQSNRSQIVHAFLDEHIRKFPGRNVFIYHQFHGDFTWGVASDADKVESQFQVKRKDLGGATEYYNIVSFAGDGWIEKKIDSDGGYLNWGYWGNIVDTSNGGNKISFKKIDNPDTIDKSTKA